MSKPNEKEMNDSSKMIIEELEKKFREIDKRFEECEAEKQTQFDRVANEINEYFLLSGKDEKLNTLNGFIQCELNKRRKWLLAILNDDFNQSLRTLNNKVNSFFFVVFLIF